MSRRTTGIGFIFIAAVLKATHFISAAIFGSNVASWSRDLFNSMLQYTDQGLTILSLVALAVGILYLIWAEILDRRVGE